MFINVLINYNIKNLNVYNDLKRNV